MTQEYKYTLIISGQKDHKCFKAACKEVSDFTLYKDSKAKVILHDEYLLMIKENKIDPAKSYWSIGPDRIGLVALARFKRYSTTWDELKECFSSFEAGWYAAKQ